MTAAVPRADHEPNRDPARTSALSAREQAADAFLECDESETTARATATALHELDLDGSSPLLKEVERACRPAHDAAVAWIATLDANQPVLDDPRAPRGALVNAAQAFSTVRTKLQSATEPIVAFQRKHADAGRRVQAARDVHQQQLRELAEQLDRARTAVASAEAAGLAGGDLHPSLAEAEQLAGSARDPASGVGRAAGRAAIRARDSARNLAVEAERRVRAASDTPVQLRSIATRLDGLAGRAKAVPAALSALRRDYSLACSAGIDDAAERIAAELAAARTELAAARAAADRQQWDDAVRVLGRVRSAAERADALLEAVTSRVAELAEVRREPRRPLDNARFAVRDAQQLVVASGQPATGEIPVLDALAERLNRASTLLRGANPDYWSYLQETRELTAQAKASVARVRAALAGR